MIILFDQVYDSCGLIFVDPKDEPNCFIYGPTKLLVNYDNNDKKKVFFKLEWANPKHCFWFSFLKSIVFFLKNAKNDFVLGFKNLRLNTDSLEYNTLGVSYVMMNNEDVTEIYTAYTRTIYEQKEDIPA